MSEATISDALAGHAFVELLDLAQERLGGAVIWATDDFFAEKENLLRASKPVFIDGKYTDRGKWMDGWESRRKRVAGHDSCIVRLGVPGVIRGVVVDTAFFRGNYPEGCSLEGCLVSGNPTPEELLSSATQWTEILPRAALRGDSLNPFKIESPYRYNYLRFHIYPDGGVARLRVHGDAVPDRRFLGRPGVQDQEIDLAAVENGGRVVTCNDMFFGSRHNLIFPGRSVNMGDGWETKRSRRAGPDWAVVELAARGTVHRVEVDTNHFKGNYPESCALLVRDARGATQSELEALARSGEGWSEILARTKLQPHTRHFYEAEVAEHAPATHVLVRIWPDGGISRLRLWGTVDREGREHCGLRDLATLTPAALERALLACGGSTRWARELAAERPYSSLASLLAAADRIWASVGRDDVLEAFSAHPRIGEKKAEVDRGATAKTWSTEEQAGMSSAQADTKSQLAVGNRDYEARFGYIYIVCATGKTAEEMLAILRERLGNDPETEFARAREEQRKIQNLRLEKLIRR
ncbi:MAG: allantoicase [Polyangiaceae bacterium]